MDSFPTYLYEAMYVMRYSSAAELALVSVERVRDFCQIQSEPPSHTNIALPPDWPFGGKLVADNLSVRYAEGLTKVLQGIGFDIEPGTRVALVGATGSGKSTLSLAIMRIIEACGGKIYLDNVDISEVGLYDLRSRITIVPQDPVSIR